MCYQQYFDILFRLHDTPKDFQTGNRLVYFFIF